MITNTFSIPVYRKAAVKKRLDFLVKKAIKYGNEDIKYSFGETSIQELKNQYGEKIRIEYVDIHVSGNAPLIKGWKLLGRIEIMQGENLIHTVPGLEVDLSSKYREHSGYCDHCQTNRTRNDVYILSNGDEEIAVGRTCLRDHLGIDDPKLIVSRAQFFEELKSFQEEDGLGYGGHGFYSVDELLLLSAAFIRQFGFISRTRANETGDETTGEFVHNCLRGTSGYSIKHNEEDLEWVEKTKNFFRSQENFGNTYLDNIRVLMKEDIADPKHVALLASSVFTSQRELVKKEEIEEQASKSEFVGEVKERLRGLELTLTRIVNFGMGQFGYTYLHVMEDNSDNVFSWITGNKIEEPEGTKLTLDGTVKQHKLYNDVKQTVLTRAKLK